MCGHLSNAESKLNTNLFFLQRWTTTETVNKTLIFLNAIDPTKVVIDDTQFSPLASMRNQKSFQPSCTLRFPVKYGIYDYKAARSTLL